MNKHALIAVALAAGAEVADIAAEHGVSKDYVRAVRNRERNRQKHGTVEYPAEKPKRRVRCREYQRRRWADPVIRAATMARRRELAAARAGA